ncbi:MAG TPA: hypothetical protein PKY73_06930 [Hyphomonas sp.]|nr:hypothetical protein [Hyphomonas sp.]HRK67270.1 hypothetical protein [Hyphomonas sp.]
MTRHDPSSGYSEGDIFQAMQTVAWIIDLYGDAYWPIFERLEEELAAEAHEDKSLKITYHNIHGNGRLCQPQCLVT